MMRTRPVTGRHVRKLLTVARSLGLARCIALLKLERRKALAAIAAFERTRQAA